MSIETNLFKDVDTTRAGEVIFVSDDIPVQKILYGVNDVFKKKVYYTEEADKYIKDSRIRKRGQQYLINYLYKIPGILKDPSIVIVDCEDIFGKTLLYYKELFIKEKNRQIFSTLVVKLFRERIIYNFYPQESGKIKRYAGNEPPKVLHLKSGYKKQSYFRR